MKTGSTHEIESFPGDWIAYVAAICAGLFCAVSLYWASGGTAGLHTVGGFAERMARAGGSQSTTVIWVTVVVKAVGVLLPLSLVRPWGRIVTRRWRAAACGAASVILVLYGGIQVIAEALVELGMYSTCRLGGLGSAALAPGAVGLLVPALGPTPRDGHLVFSLQRSC